MKLFRLDWTPAHRQPSGLRILIATIVSLLGSLLADAAIVAIGTRAFPSTKGYVALSVLRLREAHRDRRSGRLCSLARRDPHLL